MSNHNICLYKEVKKKYICCNLKTTEFLDCALIGVCAVIRSNTVLGVILSRQVQKYKLDNTEALNGNKLFNFLRFRMVIHKFNFQSIHTGSGNLY